MTCFVLIQKYIDLTHIRKSITGIQKVRIFIIIKCILTELI